MVLYTMKKNKEMLLFAFLASYFSVAFLRFVFRMQNAFFAPTFEPKKNPQSFCKGKRSENCSKSTPLVKSLLLGLNTMSLALRSLKYTCACLCLRYLQLAARIGSLRPMSSQTGWKSHQNVSSKQGENTIFVKGDSGAEMKIGSSFLRLSFATREFAMIQGGPKRFNLDLNAQK